DPHGDGQAGAGRDDRVGGLQWFGARLRHDGRGPPVHLFHPDDVVARQPQLPGQPLLVRGDGGRIVTDVVAEVEGVVRGDGPATGPGGDYATNPHATTLGQPT